jgi:hypothetical protein
MVKTRAWPVRAMYLLIAAALAISLIIIAAPPQKAGADCTADVCAEWERVDTPTTDGWVLAPESYIIDYHTADEGEVAYAIVYAYDEDPCEDSWTSDEYRLLKSDDYCATWTDLTDAVEDVIDVPNGDYIDYMMRVATDWMDPEFVAIALWWWDQSAGNYYLHVFFSTDGGATFDDAGEVEDGGVDFAYMADVVSDLVVTPESGGDRDIIIGGTAQSPNGAGLFRCTVTGDSPGAWRDVTDPNDYEGWDNMWPGDSATDDIYSWIVTDIIVSPSWTADKTVLVTTIAYSNATTYEGVYLQCGSFGTSPGWNAKSTLGIDVIEIKTDASANILLPTQLVMIDARGIAGITLPEDYNSKNSDDRVLWVWVNYYDSGAGNPPMTLLAPLQCAI